MNVIVYIKEKYTQDFSLEKEKSHWSKKKQSLDFYFCMVLVVTLFNIKDRYNNKKFNTFE